jgi:hypothetical protein
MTMTTLLQKKYDVLKTFLIQKEELEKEKY